LCLFFHSVSLSHEGGGGVRPGDRGVLMEEPAGADVRYTAFLSYSHKDAAAAARLHRRLESYRVPKRLVGTETPRGPMPQRLWPIFRDREELPAASDLSETVRSALAQSGALIILCSPSAAGSLWVAEEIETFRKVHPDRPILAAILEGDPPDCFPAALRAFGQDGTWHEPLATDLRRGADGKHLGLLKLVAGITGIGLDDLVQRDASRRVRRTTTLGTLALIGSLIMAALALVAIDSRREAERQRAEVERQIEFMVTDLRERLKSVGRLDVLDAVNRQVLDYYRRQHLDDLDPDSLEHRARLLQAMGEDDLARGQLGVARAAFDDAYRTTAEQLDRSPDDPVRIYAHAQSEFWVGEVYRLLRDWPAAYGHFRRYALAAEHLVALAPTNPDYLMEAGYSASNIGRVQLSGLHDPVAAEASFTTALRWFERAEQARPGDRTARRKQANAYANIADTFYERRLWPQALTARRRQYDIYLPLYRATPDNMELLYELATAERGVGRHMAILNQRAAARPFFRAAYQHASALRDHDPRNVTWLLLKVTIECDLLLGSPGQSDIMPRAQLRNNVAAAVRELSARHHPRVSEIARCARLAAGSHDT